MYKKHYILIAISFLFFLFLSFFLIMKENLIIDVYVYNKIEPFISPSMTSFFKCVTWFGSAIGVILLAAIFLIILKDNRYKIALLINLIGAVLLNQGLKFLFMRERPNNISLIKENGFSFPSGHSSIALAFYGFLIYIVSTKFQNKRLKYMFITILSILIILVGVSRIYLGVHYFSDVIGGYLITLSYLILFIIIFEKKKFISKFDKKK